MKELQQSEVAQKKPSLLKTIFRTFRGEILIHALIYFVEVVTW